MSNTRTCNWRFLKSYINTDIWVFECPICHSKVEILANENVADKFPVCQCGADMRGNDND